MNIALLAPKSNLVRNGLVAEYSMAKNNLLQYSEDFSQSAWSKNNVTFSNGKLVEDTTSNMHYFSQPITITIGQTYTTTFAVKKGERNYCAIEAPLGQFAYFDLNNGVITKTSGCTAKVATSSDGYYKCSITVVSVADISNCRLYVSPDGVEVNYTGDGSSGIYVRNAQLNLGSTPLDYKKTLDNQTLWNSVTTPLSVTNLVQGFVGSSDTPSSTSAWQYFSKTSNWALTENFGDGQTIPLIANRNYYFRHTLSPSSVALTSDFSIYSSTNSCTIYSSSNPSTRIASGVVIPLATDNYYPFTTTDATSTYTVDSMLAIDLTALFGSGKEPTQAQCDMLFANWFDGTQVMALPQYNGQLGSTTGSDTNDPTWTGQGLSFTTDDYVQLPYMINAEQDFTVYLVANVGSNAPSGVEWFFGAGNSSSNSQYLGIYRDPSGSLNLNLINNAGTGAGTSLSGSSLTTGKRLIAIKRKNNQFYIKDVISNSLSNFNATPSSPITFNQMSLGALLRMSASGYLNQPEYYASFYTRATTDGEDQQMLRYIRQKLAQKGVMI